MCYLFRSEIVWKNQQFRKKARHSSSCQMHSWDLSTYLSCGLIRKLWRTTRVSVGKFPRTSAFNINHLHLIKHLSSQSHKLCSFEAISDQGPKRYEVLGKLTWWKFMLEYVRWLVKKTRIFYGQADREGRGGQPSRLWQSANLKILTHFYSIEYDSMILKTHFISLWGVSKVHFSCP